ncbi:tail fiber assembly protein [Vibrio mangrovi]|uniref:Tail fiber assembly protein n=1 Tax=Vibrio mangrovi TaxID=474394 RepID=A0A1Y6IW09_9VIBR|nr:tail fiber assembly protein [Vibrio mangrovi]MDW6004719.1 tail fiber assembly protein [Vibrio mangrovi]SMS01010.1 hypothetical protein VIM7927_02287 [Vibrio mangrovi]
MKIIHDHLYQGIHFLAFPVSNTDQDGHTINPDLSAEFLQAAYQDERWSEIRRRRDLLIARTDWTQTIDSPVTDEKQKAFSAYRQILRDIPQTYSDPDEVVWPEQPETHH